MMNEYIDFDIDKLVPPPDGIVVKGDLGTVVMSENTFKAFEDVAEGEEIKWERKENGD